VKARNVAVLLDCVRESHPLPNTPNPSRLSMMRMPAAVPSAPVLPGDARAVFAKGAAVMFAATALAILGKGFGAAPAVLGMALFTALVVLLDRRLEEYHPHGRFGGGNRITLLRAGIACLLAARLVEPATFSEPERWMLAGAAGVALLLDGADGWAARRQGLVSAFGARFDMEVDAFSTLVLAALAVRAAGRPGWVLAIGLMRYAYVAAGGLMPALRRPLPAKPGSDRRRKTIAVCQSVALIAALTPALPRRDAAAICAIALALLAYSFAADIVLLHIGSTARVAPAALPRRK
jgi:phosphatidylglycerophosphate synthase